MARYTCAADRAAASGAKRASTSPVNDGTTSTAPESSAANGSGVSRTCAGLP